ncbi:hypothetical protein V6N13_131739 [Hibiscus sabdariffa]
MVSGSPYFRVSFFFFVLGCSVCGSLAGDPYVFYDWTVSYLTTSPLGDKQQHFATVVHLNLTCCFYASVFDISLGFWWLLSMMSESCLFTTSNHAMSYDPCIDWYTKSHKGLRKDVENGVDLGVPDGILINGLGPYRYDQALVKDGIVYQIINVEPGPLPDPPNVYDTYFSMNQARSIRWNVSAGAARPNPQGSFKYGDITVTDVGTYNKWDGVARSTTQVFPGAWTAILVSLDNAGIWNIRAQNLDSWYLGQEAYVSVVNPEVDNSEVPLPENSIYCGILSSLQKDQAQRVNFSGSTSISGSSKTVVFMLMVALIGHSFR